MTKIVASTVQKWGNSLAVRIPSSIARSAHFQPGTPVEVAIQGGIVLVKLQGAGKMTLDERLDIFDPQKHSGEAMVSASIGKEKL